MANWTELKNAISAIVRANGNQEITGQNLQNVLTNIVDSIGENPSFVGLADINTSPGLHDGPIFYIAISPGTYVNFNNIEVTIVPTILLNSDGNWQKLDFISLATVYIAGLMSSADKTKLDKYADTFASNPSASKTTSGLMSSADKTKLDSYPSKFIKDLGFMSSTDAGDAEAAKSEIAGDRTISFIRYTTQGVSALKVTTIFQWCNGINETGQIKFVDKAQWRRNVTGATGVAGAPTNAFRWERTGAHYLGYDAANRKIQLKDYNQTAFRDVQLPLATTSQAGLMSSVDKTKLDKYADTFTSNPSASETTSGLMNGTDKKNLERIIRINQNILTLETDGITSLTVPVSSSFTADRLHEVLSSKYGRLVINIYYDLVWYNITPLYSFINTDGSELKFAWLNPTTGQYVLTTWKLGGSGETWLVSQAQF